MSNCSVPILRMQSASLALEELLVTAQKQHCLTVGIYESAKLLNAWVETINYGLSLGIIVFPCCICSAHFPDTAIAPVWQLHTCGLLGVCCFSSLSNVSLGFPRDPDSVVLCVLAADDEEDVALQIHFTLLQSFCCDSGINILRVSGVQRLWQLLGGVEESGDLHCMLVTVGLLRQETAWLQVSRCILHVKIQKRAALPLPHLLLCTGEKKFLHICFA